MEKNVNLQNVEKIAIFKANAIQKVKNVNVLRDFSALHAKEIVKKIAVLEEKMLDIAKIINVFVYLVLKVIFKHIKIFILFYI